jgi:hypothetical protein
MEYKELDDPVEEVYRIREDIISEAMGFRRAERK